LNQITLTLRPRGQLRVKAIVTDGRQEPSPNYQDESSWRDGIRQYVKLLDSLRLEIADVLNNTGLEDTDHDPNPTDIGLNVRRSPQPEIEPRRRNEEIGWLSEQVHDLGVQSIPKISKLACDFVQNNDAPEIADSDKIQEDILNIFREISQEKRKQETKACSR
jgi:hypothetical protein